MGQVVTAVYEEGVLRPLDPLNLHEHQEVLIEVLPGDAEGKIGEEAIRILVAAGLMRPPEPSDAPVDPVSEERRRTLAELLGKATGKPLSEIIIDDRGE